MGGSGRRRGRTGCLPGWGSWRACSTCTGRCPGRWQRLESGPRLRIVPESYPALRRVERDALIACAAIAAAAWAVARGNVQAPLGVFGGGALAWISYSGIKGGIDALTGAEGAGSGVRMAIGLVKFFTRYAILAVAAYVIMARLRLPPLAVFAGASSLVVAVAVEAVRGIQWKS